MKEQGGDSGAKANAVTGGGGGMAGADAAAGVGAAGVAGATAEMIPFGPLGLGCDPETPCETGLTCFAAGATDWGLYSPAGGLCSKACEADSDCTAIEAAARCVELSLGIGASPGICVTGCTLGDNAACGGRDELACWPIDSGAPGASSRVCLPTCNHDEQCPAGTVCDGAYNLCSSVAPAGGLVISSECDPDSETNSCAEGFCIELDGGGACSAYCRRGSFPQCGGNGEDATCGWVFFGDEAAGDVDVGMCAGTCACDAECARGSHCVLHADREGMRKPGICTVGAELGIEVCN